MAMNLSDYIITAFSLSFLVDSITNVVRIRSQKATEKRLLDESGKKSTELVESFKTLLSDTLEKIGQHARLASPKEGVRCYAVLIQRGIETRMLIQPAQTFEEMVELVTKEVGVGWAIVSSAYADILVPKIEVPKTPTVVVPDKSPKIMTFISSLEYSRDRWATNSFQKGALTAIINRIKKEYGNISSSAS